MESVVYRHEFKYLVSDCEIELIKNRIKNIMTLDKHVSMDSKYVIRSLYFDDIYDRCYYDVENGTEPRAKFRVRTYNNSIDSIRLELKIKEHGMNYKRSCKVTMDEVDSFVRGGGTAVFTEAPRLLQSLNVDRKINLLRPVVITEYERIPFVYRHGNVRVTFDTNLMASQEVERFFEKEIIRRPVLPAGIHLMEVKYDHFLPDYLYSALQINNLQRISFSKFYLCRKYSVLGGMC